MAHSEGQGIFKACLHPSGVPTHLPLSRPFCCPRTYLVKSLQEVTSQEESFVPDISGYIRERVKEANITVYHLDPIQWWKFGVATR